MQIEPGHGNPLLDQALAIGEDDSDDERLTADDAQTPAPVVTPKTGSFERFMSTFGTPARWAGRT